MKSCSFLLSLFLLSFFSIAQCQSVKISGSGKGYESAELSFYKQTDPVSKKLMPVSRTICDGKGMFASVVPLEDKGVIFINAGIYSFYFYAVEGKEYELKLPDLVKKTPAQEQDAYFIPVRVMPEIINAASDINNLIGAFDREFDPVFNRVTDRVVYNVRREEIPLLIEKLNPVVPRDTSEFYRDFVTFRLIMLNQVASGEYPGRLEDSILINRRFLPDNPAYLDLIEQMFGRYFPDLFNGNQGALFSKAMASASLYGLKNAIRSDGKVSSAELQEYIILLNIFPAFYDGSVSTQKGLAIIDSIMINGSSAYLRNLAASLSFHVTSLSEGQNPPAFRLRQPDGREVTPDEYAGKYLIISFARSDNYNSVSEYGILNTWINKYSDDLQVVTILRDSDFKKGYNRMRSYGFLWDIVDGSDSDMLEYNYDVKSYPSFIMVDPAGKIAVRNCPFPSENLESVAAKIVSGRVR